MLRSMWESWNDVFRKTLGPTDRSLSELREHRNKWAHQQAFSGDDAYRALDSKAPSRRACLGGSGTGRPHRHREQPHAEIHHPRVRARVAQEVSDGSPRGLPAQSVRRQAVEIGAPALLVLDAELMEIGPGIDPVSCRSSKVIAPHSCRPARVR